VRAQRPRLPFPRASPSLVTTEEGDKTSEDVEALMICFETGMGNVFMNVALRYNKRRMSDHIAVGARAGGR